jgi:hypothetical protein
VWKRPQKETFQLIRDRRIPWEMAGTIEDQGWRSQRQSSKQTHRNSGQCGRGPSWRSQPLPSNQRQASFMGAWQGQWRTMTGDLNASHLIRNREIQGSAVGIPAGDLNPFHLIRDRENSVGSGQRQWWTRAGALNASHINRSISLSEQNGKRGLKCESQPLPS